MDIKKISLGTLGGTIAFFLLGWLVYGMLLKDFMAANTNPCIMRTEEEMMGNMWLMIVSNGAWALYLALVLMWSNSMNAMSGAKIGGITALLFGISINLMLYTMYTIYLGRKAILVDVVAWTFTSAIGGAVIGWILGMGKKESA